MSDDEARTVYDYLTRKEEQAENAYVKAKEAARFDSTVTSIQSMGYWRNVASALAWAKAGLGCRQETEDNGITSASRNSGVSVG